MDGEIITIYLPIFEEKLAKLEARGRGTSDEATRLRHAIQWAQSGSTPAPSVEIKTAA